MNQNSGTAYLWERQLLPEGAQWVEESISNYPGWHDATRKTNVGLVLAGGGDRGIAHIGVMQALEENGMPIRAIAGTSMGSIVGGLYACGYSVDSLKEIVKHIDWGDIFADYPARTSQPLWVRLNEKPREPGMNVTFSYKWFPVAFDLGSGLRSAQKLTHVLAKYTLMYDFYSGFEFDNLQLPFGAVITNFDKITKSTELKRHGTLSTALRASSSLPLLFEPMYISGTRYIDGGVLDDLPVSAFIPFDTLRGPVDTMNIIGEDTINFVLAVYPLVMKGVRESEDSLARGEPQTPGEPIGLYGLDIKMKTADIARNFHLWNSWDAAHAKIDINVTGMYEFELPKLQAKIDSGYRNATAQVDTIKKMIASLEDTDIEGTSYYGRIQSMQIMEITCDADSVDITSSPIGTDIKQAISVVDGKYIHKTDIGDALRRIYNSGDFSNVTLKGALHHSCWDLTFYVETKNVYTGSLIVNVNPDTSFPAYDSIIEKIINDTIYSFIYDKKRYLNFEEIKKGVEIVLVNRGFISPRVTKVEYKPGDSLTDASLVDTLTLYVQPGERVKTVEISCSDDNLKENISNEFTQPVTPDNILKNMLRVQKFYDLKTIAVEGFRDSTGTLIIAARGKTSYTLEFPSLTFELGEGINLFGEARSRVLQGKGTKRHFAYSWYCNYTQNFPLKFAQQIPQGQRICTGLQRYSSASILPDLELYCQTMMFSDSLDSLTYDMREREINAQAALPQYLYLEFLPIQEIAVIPAVEFRYSTTFRVDEVSQWEKRLFGKLGIRADLLDRIIFPESGYKIGLSMKTGKESTWWWRARGKVQGVKSTSIFGKTVTLTGWLYGTGYTADAPEYQRYHLGGLTPRGSYHICRCEHEDLPGYMRSEFSEPLMWRVGGSLRYPLTKMSPLENPRVNIYIVGSFDVADAIPQDAPKFEYKRLKFSPVLSIYFDTNYLNVGIGVLLNKVYTWNYKKALHLSLVYYGFGF